MLSIFQFSMNNIITKLVKDSKWMLSGLVLAFIHVYKSAFKRFLKSFNISHTIFVLQLRGVVEMGV